MAKSRNSSKTVGRQLTIRRSRASKRSTRWVDRLFISAGVVLRHPLTILLCTFLLTSILGARLQENQKRVEATQTSLENARKSVDRLYKAIGELQLRSAIVAQQKSPKSRENFDETVVSAFGTILAEERAIGRYYESKNVGPLKTKAAADFSDIEEAVYAAYPIGQAFLEQQDSEKFVRLWERVLQCMRRVVFRLSSGLEQENRSVTNNLQLSWIQAARAFTDTRPNETECRLIPLTSRGQSNP
jgi:hypothetical protein